MKKTKNEQELDAVDEAIPKLAGKAFRSAYAQALKSKGHLLVARKGQLVEVKIDGSSRVVRGAKSSTPVAKGTVKVRGKRTPHG
jgi:hypothetical protein